MCYVFFILADVSVIYLAELFVYALVGLQSGVDVSIGGNRLVFVIVADDIANTLAVDGQAGCKVNGIERAVRLIFANIPFIGYKRGIYACVRGGGIGICSTDNVKKGFFIDTYGDAGIEARKIPSAIGLILTYIFVFKRGDYCIDGQRGVHACIGRRDIQIRETDDIK